MIGVPLYATECVRVVVDYGTASDAPAGAPNTRCVTVPDDAVAADALKGRARYKGNFLCAIDGYPESGCGDEPPSPYWSFWVWKNGKWVYSSEGVATYPVGDSDGDGHPDPLGFRYHPVDAKSSPRANPAYPTPTPSPEPTTAPPPPVRTTTAAAPTTFASSNLASSGTRTPRTTATTTAATPTPRESLVYDVPADFASPGDPVPLTASGSDGGGFPLGTAAGGALAAALLGAAAWRFRKAP